MNDKHNVSAFNLAAAHRLPGYRAGDYQRAMYDLKRRCGCKNLFSWEKAAMIEKGDLQPETSEAAVERYERELLEKARP